MSIYHENEAEFFKIARSFVEPVDPAAFDRLYMAAVLLFRINIFPMYSFGEFTGVVCTEPTKNSDKVEELWGPTRTTDGRLLDVRSYPLHSRQYRSKGLLATIGVAPEPSMSIQDLFNLSTDGVQYWITEDQTARSIGPEELEILTLNIERA